MWRLVREQRGVQWSGWVAELELQPVELAEVASELETGLEPRLGAELVCAPSELALKASWRWL